MYSFLLWGGVAPHDACTLTKRVLDSTTFRVVYTPCIYATRA